MDLTIAVEGHPLLEICAFVTRAAQPTSRLQTPVITRMRDLLELEGAEVLDVALA